jgi:hypothetical protein
MLNSPYFYIKHLEICFDKAEKNESRLPDLILKIPGFTGKKTRHFYNNLLNIKDSRYLEIGTWAGSSVSAAMFKNKSSIVCIDNWSEFNGQEAKETFFARFDYFKGKNKTRFIEQDCFKVDINELPKFNIYLYDGAHEYEDHYKALTYYVDCFDDVFIFVVDDWNWENVRNGTMDAIKATNVKILWKKEIRLTHDNEHTPDDIAKATWWNGIAVFLLEKPQPR